MPKKLAAVNDDSALFELYIAAISAEPDSPTKALRLAKAALEVWEKRNG